MSTFVKAVAAKASSFVAISSMIALVTELSVQSLELAPLTLPILMKLFSHSITIVGLLVVTSNNNGCSGSGDKGSVQTTQRACTGDLRCSEKYFRPASHRLQW